MGEKRALSEFPITLWGALRRFAQDGCISAGGAASKQRLVAQQFGARAQIQTDGKLTWRVRIARSSLIRRWAHNPG
jgi:hypothetical protein